MVMTQSAPSYWDEAQSPSHPKRRKPQLPFEQRGITGTVLSGSGIPSAGSLLGMIRVERDAVTVRGFLGRSHVFPRSGSTHLGRATGLFVRGIRLHDEDGASDVVFFSWSADAAKALAAALRAAGFL
jgi:hypothetical protein